MPDQPDAQDPYFAEYQLGISSGTIALDRRSAIRTASCTMAQQARRELLLFDRSLEADLYDNSPFVDAIRRLALGRQGISVRLLLLDPRSTAAKSSPRLLELTRQLTSRIALQRASDEDKERLDAFLIADERGYVRRRNADLMDAVVDFNDPLGARKLRTEFDELWSRSEADPEFRRLLL